MTVRRSIASSSISTLAVLALVLAGLLVSAGAARADLYRYWSVWQENNGQWTFVETAPDSLNPANGSVMGWRFGAGGVDAASTRAPRATPTFSDVCGDAAPASGEKAVGLVIDTGTAADSPDGSTPPSPIITCAVVPESYNAVQVLQFAADTRIEGGLVCAVLDYPATGCGDTIAGAEGTPTDTPDDLAVTFTTVEPLSATGTNTGSDTSTTTVDAEGTSSPSGLLILAGVAGVLAIGAVAVAMARRNKELDARQSDGNDDTTSDRS